MSKKFIFFLLLMILGIVVVLVAFLGYYLYSNFYLPSKLTLSSPLANVEFPSEQIQYPANWPDDFKFPENFVLVDSVSGSLPESTSTGWSVRLIYQGKAEDVVKATSEFLESKAWTITEIIPVDSDNISILVERDTASGIIAISRDPNKSSQTLITATFFP